MSRFHCLLISLLLFISQPLVAEDLLWTGCGVSKKGFMQTVVDHYHKKTGVTIRLSGGGATKGIRLTQAQRSDMGGSCRHQLEDNEEVIEEENQILLLPVAWDAIVVLMSQYNPLNNITTQNLTKIFSGEINNWKDVGGNDESIIRLVRKSKISGVGYMARLMIFYDTNMYFKREFEFKSTGPLEKWFEIESVIPKVRNVIIERKRRAIALDGYSSARKIPHKDVKMVSIDGVMPSKDSILSGEYPYIRPLYLAVRKDRVKEPEIKQFMEFIISDEGQDIIAQSGTISFLQGEKTRAAWNEKAKKVNIEPMKASMADYLK